MADPTSYLLLLQDIHDYIVQPLRQFKGIASRIDQIHFDNYMDFNESLEVLFAPPTPAMAGQGANALVAKWEDYQHAEWKQLGYEGDPQLSQVIGETSQYCKTAADNIQNLIDHFPPAIDLPSFPFPDPDDQQPPPEIPDIPVIGDILFSIMGQKSDGINYPITPDMLDITKNTDVPRRKYALTRKQLDALAQMGQERRRWENHMRGLLGNPNLYLKLPESPNNLSMSFITLPPVVLTPAQQQEANKIMGELNDEGITGIDPAYVEELIHEGFSESDIVAAAKGWKAAGKSNDQINDLLFLAAFHILLGPYYHNDMVPYGMSKQQYQQFVSTLRSGLNNAGYCAGADVGGSSVTGFSYTNGMPFDSAHQSDYDVVLTGKTLWDKAKALGIKLTDGGTRTRPLRPNELAALGLYGMWQQLEKIAGREVHFVIYNSLVTNSSKAPALFFFGNSCAGGS